MQLTSTEWKVMNALWRHHPATAREIEAGLEAEKPWAYTTLKTLLARLVEKGAIAETKQGNVSHYEPLLEQKDARRHAVESLLDRVFDGAAGSLLQHLLNEGKLSRKDRDALADMLKSKDKPR